MNLATSIRMSTYVCIMVVALNGSAQRERSKGIASNINMNMIKLHDCQANLIRLDIHTCLIHILTYLISLPRLPQAGMAVHVRIGRTPVPCVHVCCTVFNSTLGQVPALFHDTFMVPFTQTHGQPAAPPGMHASTAEAPSSRSAVAGSRRPAMAPASDMVKSFT